MKKSQKEKEQKKDQKKKLKIIIEKNPLKSKINPIETEPKKYNRNIMTHNSISTKEEIKKKLSPSKIRNKQNKLNLLSDNTCKNSKLLSSNHLFLTCEANSQSNLDDKKIKKNKKLKNFSNGGERINPKELSSGPVFKKDKFKKTIIIDDEGNNNLNLNIDKDYDYKNILKNSNNTIISNSFSGNTDTNSLFMSSNKSYVENYNSKNYSRKGKENDIRQTIIDKNEEERRLIEYRKIFNLLNSNIEQFKKMFTNKDSNDKNKKIVIQNKKDNAKNNKNKNRNRNNSLDKYKNNDKDKNIKKNLSEKNLSTKNKYNKNNNQSIFSPKNNINTNTNNNNNFDINNNYSFLESSIQDDFYQSLINQTFLQNVSRTSFEMNIDDISNIPVEKEKEKVICDDEDKKNDNKELKMDIKKNIKNLENKPLEEENKKKVKQKNLEKSNEESNFKNFSNDFDKNNCIIL